MTLTSGYFIFQIKFGYKPSFGSIQQIDVGIRGFKLILRSVVSCKTGVFNKYKFKIQFN